MNNEKTLNQLWNKQNLNENPIQYSQVTGRKRKLLINTFIQNILLLITITFLSFIWYYTTELTVTAKIGITFLIASSIAFMIANGRIIFLLKKANSGANNLEYLKELVSLKSKQFILQKTFTQAYFILLSFGIFLSMMGFGNGSPYSTMIFVIALVWVLYTYFFVRPKKIKKQQHAFEEIISNLKRIEEQFTLTETQ
jgi:hypothetical protein